MADDFIFMLEREAPGPDGLAVLRARGELDVSTCGRLREALQELVAGMVRVVILDLSEVTFIDSSSLGVILSGRKQLHAQGGVLAVVSSEPHVTKLFDITALSLTIPLYPSMAAARADLGVKPVGT